MKLYKIISVITAIAFIVSFSAIYNTTDSYAATSSWQQKGASIVPTSPDDFGSANFKQSLNDLKAANANTVTLIIPYYQESIYSTDIYRGWNTPSDSSLISAMNYANSLGLNVVLKPHMETSDGQWRAYINPSDRTAWFNSYGGVLNHYADLGQQHGADQIVLGSELISMASGAVNSTNTQNWINLINDVRNRFSGTLTYSANWGPPGHSFVDEKNNIGFWPHLDYIGIAAYYELNQSWGQNDVESLRQGWGGWDRSDITPLHEKYNKQILFTEIGYRSVDGAHTDPWNSGRGGAFNEVEQSNTYEALFSYWDNKAFFAGVSLWDWKSWPTAGGQGNADYTPQNKEAENIMRNWFAGSTGGGNEEPTQSVPSDFEILGSADPTSGVIGDSIQFIVNIRPIDSNANNIVVDMELYNSSGELVKQEFFPGENIQENTTKAYSMNWQSTNSGNFTLKTGVFSGDWSQLYKWNNEVVAVNISEDEDQPPSNGGDIGEEGIEVWWPTDSSTVSGTQPFKGLLKNFSLDEYSMFWQVDGDRLNEMNNSQEDYPHKESWVDLTGWNWRTDGSAYVLNFVAKALDTGTNIAEKMVRIFIAN